MQRQYWQFYWPLSLMGFVMVIAHQFQNGVLTRQSDAVRLLATFAFAASTFVPFQAALVFLPQMTNVLARSPRAQSVCFRFTILVCLVLTAPLVVIALTPVGEALLKWAFNIEGETLAGVLRYLRYLLPLILIGGMRQYYTGLLIQSKRTGCVTLLNIFFLATVIGMLLLGFRANWGAMATLAIAQLVAGLVYLVLCFALYLKFFRLPERPEHEQLTYRETFTFFWPVAITSTMFGLSRPILYSFARRMPDGQILVASLKVTFDFAMMFHSAMNQFRNLFATFGQRDLAGLRKFMIRVWFGVTALMVLVAASPLGTFILREILGIRGRVLEMANQTILVLCLVPLAVGIRNYFHGLALVRRKTGGMALAAISRNLSIYLVAWGLYANGWLNHIAAAFILVLGFVVEAGVMAMFDLRNGSRVLLDDVEE